MKRYMLLLLIFFFSKALFAQEESTFELVPPPAEWTVPSHKEQLKLTLIIDSIRMGNKVEKLNFRRTLNITFESDYIQVKDDLYIRIFISRNQEYGKKFYSWKWDYLKKKGDKYRRLDIGFYQPMDYNQPIPDNGNYGQGIGDEGEARYIMFYYKYKLE